jgi:hypothetical protein
MEKRMDPMRLLPGREERWRQRCAARLANRSAIPLNVTRDRHARCACCGDGALARWQRPFAFLALLLPCAGSDSRRCGESHQPLHNPRNRAMRRSRDSAFTPLSKWLTLPSSWPSPRLSGRSSGPLPTLLVARRQGVDAGPSPGMTRVWHRWVNHYATWHQRSW